METLGIAGGLDSKAKRACGEASVEGMVGR